MQQVSRRRSSRKKRSVEAEEDEEEEKEGCGDSDSEVELIDRQLDQSLETKSRQHNLTTVNVKNILHVSHSSTCL